jgi:hypothetical protein
MISASMQMVCPTMDKYLDFISCKDKKQYDNPNMSIELFTPQAFNFAQYKAGQKASSRRAACKICVEESGI